MLMAGHMLTSSSGWYYMAFHFEIYNLTMVHVYNGKNIHQNLNLNEKK